MKNKINEAEIYIGEPNEIPQVKPQLDKDDKLFVMGDEMNEDIESTEMPMFVEYISDIKNETPFRIGDTKWVYVKAKYPNGETDIGVYRFDHDLVYGYEWFKSNILGDSNKEEKTEIGEDYNIYAICTDSIAKTAGTNERSKWSDEAKERYERCIKDLKGKKGYELGENKVMDEGEYGIEGRDIKDLKQDVELLFDRLNLNPIKNALEKIDTPVEKFEVVAKFAEMIGVSRNKLGELVRNLKGYSQEENIGESKNPKMSKGALLEYIKKTKTNKK